MPNGVVARLLQEGYMFDFFQVVRLLERFFTKGPGPGETSEAETERILFRPHSGLVFPPTDVKSVDLEENFRARVTVTFMGLYGVDSPLPVYFYNSIAGDPEGATPLRDFLDIFNHRLYSLFYRTWKKYKFHIHEGSPATRDNLSARTLSLAGLGTKGALQGALVPGLRLAAFAGILSMRAHGADGLRNLLEGLLGGISFDVHENIPQWIRIPHRPRVGSPVQATLGSTACIGERVFDLSGKFRVVAGPLTLLRYVAFLPGGADATLLAYLVCLYVRDFLEYDVQLVLVTKEIPELKLGNEISRLGLTTWVGRPATLTTTRIVAYHQNHFHGDR